jgi:predicted RND superfamily exporter protein
MRQSFLSDTLKINLLTFILIFLILLVSFRSALLPVLLTLTIQGAVWINFAISAMLGSGVMFLGYLIVSSIQMGATIDYAILLTSRYLEHRKTACRKDAVMEAVTASLPTIATSGGIMMLAGLVIGLVSAVSTIGSLGTLLARGTLVSVLSVLFLWPALLFFLDKPIQKTTLGLKLFSEAAPAESPSAPDETETPDETEGKE